MCAPDPNAALRRQALMEHRKKMSKYHSESLKYWNREVSVKQGKSRLTKGLSRSRSDAYSKALWALGKGRLANENLYRQKAKLMRFSDQKNTSRSNRYMANNYKTILDKQRQVESTINNTFGRNMDIAHQMIQRNHMAQVAKNRMRLGSKPEFGMPVMMPPRDSMGQLFNTLGMGLQIGSLITGMFPSDKRLKENIKEVGESDLGYTVYEFNYIGNKSDRFRGVLAQNVAKINPMAVHIVNNYLAVDYSKLDVEMEVVS